MRFRGDRKVGGETPAEVRSSPAREAFASDCGVLSRWLSAWTLLQIRARCVAVARRLRALALACRLNRSARMALAGLCGLAGVGAFGFGGLMVYYTVTMPNPRAIHQRERSPVVRILAQDGQVLAERGVAHDYMPLALLPDHVVQAVIATEDRRFFSHWGIDPWGLARAAFVNLRAGRTVQGGSTLTQQLAKNLFLSPERTLARKGEEIALAVWLEMRLSKDDILELYLNRVYFGGGAYGIEAAAQRYFKKSARELTIAEAALIAGLLKAPSRYSPANNPVLARARGRVVLSAMLAAGAITPGLASRAQAQAIRFNLESLNRDSGGLEYLVDLVLDRLPPLGGGAHAEVVVETTVDANLQRRVQRIISESLDARGEALRASQAAMVMLDMDGGIRAMVGGRSYVDSQFNRAVKARRQPGSAFKPIVYLAALEQGLTPQTRVLDMPLNIDGWAPRNVDGRYRGSVSLREALARSINTVAVRVMLDIGTQRVVRLAKRLGINAELIEKPSLALGTAELTLTELTGAYGMIANGGYSVEPHVIKRVRVSSGRILYVRDVPRLRQVVAPGPVGAVTDMMHEVMRTGTGRRAALGLHPAAGKTGTTQDFRDAWFVGFTGHVVGGVWVGNDDARTMNKVAGGSLPADIWREAMRVAHEGRPTVALTGLVAGGGPVAAAAIAVPPLPVAKPERTRLPASPLRRPEPPSIERIDEAFIARAMAGLPPARADDSAGAGVASEAAARGRTVSRLPGVMGLGVSR